MAHSFVELDKAMGSVWLVFCDCDFASVKDKRFIEADGRDWLKGKLGFVLKGRDVFSKSLIQFSVDGWGCVPSMLFDLRPNYGGGNEDNGTSFKRSHAYTATLSNPDPAAGHHWPTPLLEIPILWPPDAKNWLIGKDPDAGIDWRKEDKGTTEDEMVRWHHWLNGQEFE